MGPVFSQLYGQTECYPISVLHRADHDKARPELMASCGHPCSSVDVQFTLFAQAHHLDLDFYDQHMKPGAYGETHANHFRNWHDDLDPDTAGGNRE
tara:strand:- start:3702 stop:3989 length:288 start_codon:yes stop_codon:yes gene_type:complete